MNPIEFKAWKESRTDCMVAEGKEGEREDERGDEIDWPGDEADISSNMTEALHIAVQAGDTSNTISQAIASAAVTPSMPINAATVLHAGPFAESSRNIEPMQERSAAADARPAKKLRMQSGSADFINIISGAGGGLVTVTKKPRAMRKDKGIPRKKKHVAGDENHAPTLLSGAAATATNTSLSTSSLTPGTAIAFAPPAGM
ncbi:uncharacterized protein LAESUDRAFT_759389 [Laetiporus sulphureus 93-53]|uniref:Uncharacterized protein n=1 Tax=Laetiporus sulphureus 93-53 TaxID=1314785 RepID=A0A165EA43_9APHY|nr:uncharacterized protein LAESUDRAFT_759389 [Laetiporus sulphureus 93-53]KZT06569.1 hypothetical protein LAESUDRAFT_759389 [Laetiporus sulphureus 93-53]